MYRLRPFALPVAMYVAVVITGVTAVALLATVLGYNDRAAPDAVGSVFWIVPNGLFFILPASLALLLVRGIELLVSRPILRRMAAAAMGALAAAQSAWAAQAGSHVPVHGDLFAGSSIAIGTVAGAWFLASSRSSNRPKILGVAALAGAGFAAWWVVYPSILGRVEVRAPRSDLRSDLVGCYDLYDAAGTRVSSRNYGNASSRIRLDSLVAISPVWEVPWESAMRRVVRLDTLGRPVDSDGLPPTLHGFYWRADSLSTVIDISFHDGFHGAYLALDAPDGVDTLAGWINVSSDVPPYQSRRRAAYAVRVDCDVGG